MTELKQNLYTLFVIVGLVFAAWSASGKDTGALSRHHEADEIAPQIAQKTKALILERAGRES